MDEDFDWDDANADHVAQHSIRPDEAEGHAFWATHELRDELWDQAEPLAPDELPPPQLSPNCRGHE
jgi:hypothetical protein